MLDNTTVGAQRQTRCKSCLAKRQGHIVLLAKMFCDQSFQFDVGKDVAAINDEGLIAEPGLGILDPATGFQEIRLMNEFNFAAGIGILGEELVELPATDDAY